jgi:hypothetical protein
LRAANGAPVSFDELRDMGVENPALLCYELAAVGLAVERPREPHGALALSVRLSPARPGQAAIVEPGASVADGDHGPDSGSPTGSDSLLGRSASMLVRRPRGRGSERRVGSVRTPRPGVVISVALAAVAVVAIALVVSSRPGSSVTSSGAARRHRELASSRPATSTGADAVDGSSSAHNPQAAGNDHHLEQAGGGAATVPSRVPVSPATAAALEAEGHQLLLGGRYGAAIGDLRTAIQASGGSVSRCAEPASEACLTYAYALFDLGRALQLDGDPAAAVPVLSERLRIANQREVVEQELDLARAEST